jgi:choice-of-anchor B domain-containing protein
MASSSGRSRLVPVLVVSTLSLLTAVAWLPGFAASATDPRAGTHAPSDVGLVADRQPVQDLAPRAETPCVGGFAGSYPCKNIDLLSFMPLAQIGGGTGNSIWGWTDPQTGKEYAIFGRSTGTSFVDISDPIRPVYLGNLPTHSSSSLWRDMKVYRNRAYIVSEASNHGMQVFNLTQLRSVPNPPVTFAETAHYKGMSNTHTLGLNPQTGVAYAVGTNTCSGGLHMIDLSNPEAPEFAGCYSGDGYTHETQCVIYVGPDVEHRDKEICFASNEDTLTIVDVTDKANPAQLSRTPYSGSGYTHQGWLTGNQRTFVLNDELDEIFFGHKTKTRFFNVSNLDKVGVKSTFIGPTTAIDHNLYVNGSYIYESNYRAGLRILTVRQTAEVAYFDIYPANDSPEFNANWNNYPFFDSGVVILSGIEQGLFMVQPNL